MGCASSQEKVILTDNFFCDYLQKSKVDIRLDYIPTLKEFKNGKKPYRLDKRLDSVLPLNIYVWNKEIEPIVDKWEKNTTSNLQFNFEINEAISLVNVFQESVCSDFKVILQETLDEEIFKYDNPNRGILFQTSQLYFNENSTKAIFFIRLTRHSLSSIESAVIIKKEGNIWVYENSIELSIS